MQRWWVVLPWRVSITCYLDGSSALTIIECKWQRTKSSPTHSEEEFIYRVIDCKTTLCYARKLAFSLQPHVFAMASVEGFGVKGRATMLCIIAYCLSGILGALHGQPLGYSIAVVPLRTAWNMVGKPPCSLINKVEERLPGSTRNNTEWAGRRWIMVT